MDKRSIIGFVLIGVILIFWMFWTSKNQKPLPPNQKPQTEVQDTNKKSQPLSDTIKKAVDTLQSKNSNNEFGQIFSKNAYSLDSIPKGEKLITVENSKFKFIFTNMGGSLHRAYMKEFNTWDGHPVQLVEWSKDKELNILFTSKDGKSINTKELFFKSNYTANQVIDIQNQPDFKLQYEVFPGNDSTNKIIKTFRFLKDSYEFSVDYEFVNPNKFLLDNKYQLVWGSSLNLTEYRSDEEAQFSEAFAYMGGELVQLQPKDYNKEEIENLNGNTDYVSSRNKYFGVFLIPDGFKADGAYLTGDKIHLPGEGQRNIFSIALKKEIKSDTYEKNTYRILLSPIDYKILKSYDMELEKTMRFALDWLVRPIAQYLIIPFFNFLHLFIPNWGLVIIVFAIVLKIVLNPLTKKQTQSMQKMSKLNPKMTEIREKYKDDPQKMNSQIMKLYKEEGINPMGGCLPLLLQLPILYALFGVFRSTIELRQAPFILWIHDLSAPDILFHLPFKIPIFGIDMISGLATLMGITMFIQQKMTITDPKQKSMVYLMPVLMTLLFFSFPSGLNLYYFVFNLLSIGQQYYNTKINPPKEDEIKKPPKKGFLQKFMDRMQQQQKEMNKSRRKR